jgi:hypothetical protein
MCIQCLDDDDDDMNNSNHHDLNGDHDMVDISDSLF